MHSNRALNIEIIATSLDDVKAINQSKATAIELCAGMAQDGVTPSLELIKEAVKISRLPIRVMVRPRGGDFYYSDEEFRQMLTTIEAVKCVDAEGIVIGMIEQRRVDERIKKVMQCTESLKVTFHRAFEIGRAHV